MARLTIRDDALWAKHVADPDIRHKILDLPANAPLRLIVDGQPILFRKMSNGADGRPTPGLKADADDPESRAVWASLQKRRGEVVSLAPADLSGPTDPYLAYLNEFFHEWSTPEDAEAFDDL